MEGCGRADGGRRGGAKRVGRRTDESCDEIESESCRWMWVGEGIRQEWTKVGARVRNGAVDEQADLSRYGTSFVRLTARC